jgi:hypothetical protein
MRIEGTAWAAATLLRATLMIGGLGLMAGCAADRSDAAASAAARRPAAAAGTAQAQEGEPAYLRLKPEQTGIEAVHDDGRLTYLTFAAAPPAQTGFFDQDGRPLATARAGRVVAVGGMHRGILVRVDRDRASFVSPNPRRGPAQRPLPPEAGEYVEARAALENQAVLQQAMQHALTAAAPAAATQTAAGTRPGSAPMAAETSPAGSPSAAPATPPTPPVADGASPGTMERRPSERFSATTAPDPVTQLVTAARPANDARGTALPEVTYLDASPVHLRSTAGSRWQPDPARHPLAMPLAAAHASVAVPAHGLVRVFFATASRTIVAPDDGLGLLLREAPQADEIRVTGFTDATGSRETNDALARARADAVVQILMRRGVAPDRIFSGCIGAADYIADNATEKGRALNRRVEVVLLRDGRPLAFGGGAARD